MSFITNFSSSLALLILISNCTFTETIEAQTLPPLTHVVDAPQETCVVEAPQPVCPLTCPLGQVPQMELRGWTCNTAIERVFMPIRSGVTEFNLGEIQPMECVDGEANGGRVDHLHDIYPLVATMNIRHVTRYGIQDRHGLLVLQSAYALPGQIVIRVCNLHPEEPADAEGLLIQWVALHTDDPL